jgi:hypothetical protein
MPLQRAVGVLKMLNPNFDEQTYKSIYNEYKAVSPGGKKGEAIEQYNNVLGHASELQDTLLASSRGGNPEFLNHGLNWLEKHGYGTEAAQITAATEPLKDEFQLLMSGGYKPTESMQEAYNTIISNTATPSQIGASLKKLASTGTVRLENINERYKSLANKNVPNIITPDSLAAIEHLGIKNSKDPQDQQTWNRVQSLNSGGNAFQQVNQNLSPTRQVQPPAAPETYVFNSAAWATANPGKDVNAAIALAKQKGYEVK